MFQIFLHRPYGSLDTIILLVSKLALWATIDQNQVDK
jgi:hypothetical protein